jgi:acetyl-CoA C-acetyltransferase
MSDVCVYGVGTSGFGKQPGVSAPELAWEALLEALADAQVGEVEAAWVGTVFGTPGTAQRALRGAGIVEVPIVSVENACASGTTALHEAAAAVASGRYERVLALGVEHLSGRVDGAIEPEASDPEGREGLALPALYALAASRYLGEGAATLEQLAAVSVKNHAHGVHNPRAQHRGELTAEQVLASRMIADPLTLYQCCSIADAAAAAVLGPPRGVARDVPLRGCALRSGALWDHRSEHVWGYDVVQATARDAYAQAGVGPGDLDVLEVHDAFTIGELVTTEALGLAAEGGGGALVESGHTTLGGPQPVNPSGGLLSRGHPLGATGLAQLAEVVWQLRGEAGARQVPAPRVGLVETMGGGVAGLDGNGCVVAVLGG